MAEAGQLRLSPVFSAEVPPSPHRYPPTCTVLANRLTVWKEVPLASRGGLSEGGGRGRLGAGGKALGARRTRDAGAHAGGELEGWDTARSLRQVARGEWEEGLGRYPAPSRLPPGSFPLFTSAARSVW